jgi:hypothetical protein
MAPAKKLSTSTRLSPSPAVSRAQVTLLKFTTKNGFHSFNAGAGKRFLEIAMDAEFCKALGLHHDVSVVAMCVRNRIPLPFSFHSLVAICALGLGDPVIPARCSSAPAAVSRCFRASAPRQTSRPTFAHFLTFYFATYALYPGTLMESTLLVTTRAASSSLTPQTCTLLQCATAQPSPSCSKSPVVKLRFWQTVYRLVSPQPHFPESEWMVRRRHWCASSNGPRVATLSRRAAA